MNEEIRVKHNFLKEMEEEQLQLQQTFEEFQNFENGISWLSVDELHDFPQHKFKLYENERLDDMVKSIEELGVLTPLLVWDNDEGYIILSGHNRRKAAKLAGLDLIPCVVKSDLSFDEATYIVTESNLMQRSFSDLTHSEKAHVLKQHYEAIKNQGIRKDIVEFIEKVANGNAINTSNSNGLNARVQNEPVEKNDEPTIRTKDKTSQKYELSSTNVVRYIKISSIQDSLMNLLDENKLSFIVTYNLAFIDDKKIQDEIARYVKEEEVKINVALSEKLKSTWQEKKLRLENLEEYLFKKKKDSRPKKSKYVKLDRAKFEKYFDEDTTEEEIQEFILELFKNHFSIKKLKEEAKDIGGSGSFEEIEKSNISEETKEFEEENYDDFPDISLFAPNSEIKVKGETYYSLGGRWLKQKDYEFMKKSANHFRNIFK